MGASQSQSPARNSPRSASMRGTYRTLSNDETSSHSTEPTSSHRPSNGRSQSMRERSDRPVRSRPRVRTREHTRASGLGQSTSSSDSSPESLPPVGLLERLRRLNLDEDYDFMSFNHGTGTLSVSAPANPLALLRQLTGSRRIKCPLCDELIPLDNLEGHMKLCVQKPRVQYNVDTLLYDGGECSICLEELKQGTSIARLPCLCIYHKKCLEMWFLKSRTCPEHPECVQMDHPPPITEPKSTTDSVPPPSAPSSADLVPTGTKSTDSPDLPPIASGHPSETGTKSVRFMSDMNLTSNTGESTGPVHTSGTYRSHHTDRASRTGHSTGPQDISATGSPNNNSLSPPTNPWEHPTHDSSLSVTPGSSSLLSSSTSSGHPPNMRRTSGTSSPLATNRRVAAIPPPASGSPHASTPVLASGSKDRLTGLSYSPELPSLDTLLAAN